MARCVTVRKHYGITDLEFAVEFREVIASTIPFLIKPLENDDGFVRRKAVELIDKLANHGE